MKKTILGLSFILFTDAALAGSQDFWERTTGLINRKVSFIVLKKDDRSFLNFIYQKLTRLLKYSKHHTSQTEDIYTIPDDTLGLNSDSSTLSYAHSYSSSDYDSREE